MMNLQLLPQKAQRELIDFYQFLVERYASGKKKKQSQNNTAIKQVNIFFDQYNIDLSDFKFNRNDIYNR